MCPAAHPGQRSEITISTAPFCSSPRACRWWEGAARRWRSISGSSARPSSSRSATRTAAEAVLAEARPLLEVAERSGFDVAAAYAVIGRARRLLGEVDWERRCRARSGGGASTGRDRCRVPYRGVNRRGLVPRRDGPARASALPYLRRPRERAQARQLGATFQDEIGVARDARRQISEGVRGSRGDPPGGAGVGALPGHVRRRGVGNRSGAATSEPGSFWPSMYLLSTTGHERLRQTLWVRADAELWSGRPRESLAAANELFERFPQEASAFARVTRGWACVELDLDPGEPVIIPPIRLLAGVRPELDALRHTRRRRGRGRCAAVSRCGGSMEGQHERGRLRCAWAEGEALRRAGRGDEALERLSRAEWLIVSYGQAPLLARVRRSLRLAGASRPAARGAGCTRPQRPRGRGSRSRRRRLDQRGGRAAPRARPSHS